MTNSRVFRALLGLFAVALLTFGAAKLQASARMDCYMNPDLCDGCVMEGYNCTSCTSYYLGGGDCVLVGDCSSWYCDCSSSGRTCYYYE